jgi:hypothetical protein
MKKQNLFSSLLIGTVALSIALPSLVNADPSGTPPGGNVDATFNSVNAGYGTTAPSVGGDFQGEDAGIQGVATGASGFSGIFYGTNGISSEASSAAGMAAGFYNFAASPAVGVVLGYAGDALLASGPINLVGRIYSGSLDPTDKYVNIEDSDGVRFGDDAGTPQLTISGSTGDIADPNGDVTVADDLLSTGFSKANSGFRLTGSMGTFTMDQIGQMTRMYDNTTSPLQILDANGMDIRGGIANGSTFVDGNPVKIGEADGLLITTNGGTQGLTIAATGDIADTNSAVTLKDDDGLLVSNAASTATMTLIPSGGFSQINTSGNLQLNLASGAGTLFFYDGVGSTPLAMNKSGIWAPSSPSGPLKIIDSEGLGISDNAGNVRLLIDDTGDISNISGTNPVKFADDQGIQIANTAGTVGLTISGTGALSNNDSTTLIDDDNIYTACTASNKSVYFSGATAYCKKAVALSSAGLDVPGSIINSTAGIPIILSDADGVLMSGTGDGIFWIRPNGTTGDVSLSNENGNNVVFNGADNVIVGSTASGLQINSSGELTKLGATAVTVNDANGLSVNGAVTSTGAVTGSSVGRYYFTSWTPSTDTITPSTYKSYSVSCNSGDTAISCNQWRYNYLITPRTLYADSDTCYANVYNENGTAQYFQLQARCYSPNG